MCDRSIRSGANFSPGALETLSLIDNAKVIATYTNMPKEVLVVSTSGACRFGVPLPLLGIDQVMDVVPEFYFDKAKLATTGKTANYQKRLFASSKGRLGLSFRLRYGDFGLGSIFH
jgi:hypothetical protein